MRGLLKTASWMIASGVLIAVAGYAETGNLKTAVMASFWACLFKTPIYWVHEVIWEKVGVKKPPVDI